MMTWNKVARIGRNASRLAVCAGLALVGLAADVRADVVVDSPWKGKKVAVFGDSISDKDLKGWKHWWAQLAEMTGIEPFVYAKNGWQWNGLPKQVDAMAAENVRPDAILVFLGTNDFNANVQLGQWWFVVSEKVDCNGKEIVCNERVFDFSANTLRGRINIALRRLKHDYPDSQIVLLTPIHRGLFKCSPTNVRAGEEYANTLGLWLDDYVRCVQEAGQVWSVPVIDLYGESGLYPSDSAYGKCFNRADTDLLHPNSEGHRRMAALIAAKLSALPPTFSVAR